MTCLSTDTRSGKDGYITYGGVTVARVTQWTVNPTLATTSEWGDSDTAGYTARYPGRKDCTFTAEGKYDSSTNNAYSVFQPGDYAAVTLNITALLFWNFPCALCTDFNLTVNIDAQEVIGWTSSWGSDGIYYLPSDA